MDLKTNAKLIAALEALLFTYGEPMELKRIVKMLSAHAAAGAIDDGTVRELSGALREKLALENSGLMLIAADNKLQLTTKPDLKAVVEGIVKEELTESLTPAALETLAIIAYAGSVPRSTIDYVRGVNSSFTVRSLLLRGLIDREADPRRANVYRYKPSFDLLRHLGLGSAQDLPEYAKFRETISKLMAPETQ